MNTVNKSSGYSPFLLRTGRSPRLIPPLVATSKHKLLANKLATEIIVQLETDVADAKDNLLTAKFTQAEQANKTHGPDPDYKSVHASNCPRLTAGVHICGAAKRANCVSPNLCLATTDHTQSPMFTRNARRLPWICRTIPRFSPSSILPKLSHTQKITLNYSLTTNYLNLDL
jgi:hypothetical protein